MKNAIAFKVLQRRNKFRNPNHVLSVPDHFQISNEEEVAACQYLKRLESKKIRFTFPQDAYYPKKFYFMKEPPLFLEFIGEPVWMKSDLLSVVGSRDCHELTRTWILDEVGAFLKTQSVGLASGGAVGVDQYGHLAAVRSAQPTVVVLPSGLDHIYPRNLIELKAEILKHGGCFLTEFELDQKIHKHFFYFRNRLISALGKMCLVAQSTEKSGTMLTVHHALENGRPVLTIPSHPGLVAFSGNLKLMRDGAYLVSDSAELLDFWRAESWPD